MKDWIRPAALLAALLLTPAVLASSVALAGPSSGGPSSDDRIALRDHDDDDHDVDVRDVERARQLSEGARIRLRFDDGPRQRVRVVVTTANRVGKRTRIVRPKVLTLHRSSRDIYRTITTTTAGKRLLARDGSLRVRVRVVDLASGDADTETFRLRD